VERYCDVLEHVDDIVTLIFQYINLLQKEGPQEWIFRECQVSYLHPLIAVIEYYGK